MRGVKDLSIEAKFVDESIRVNDIGPKTEWKPKSYSLEVDLSITASSDALKLLPTPSAEAKAIFKYAWNPKVAAVLAGGSANIMNWVFNRTEGTYLDGGHKLIVLFERPRNVNDVKLTISKITATYDVSFGSNDAVTQVEKEIEIKTKTSS